MPIAGELRPLQIDDMVEFVLFDHDGGARFDDVEILADPLFNITVRQGGEVIAEIGRGTPLLPAASEEIPSDRLFRPPLFGMTALGTGHGFDPDADTSGMILWVNRRGIIIDPPVHSIVKLARLGVSPKLIDSVILTHCHADHDAGTLQKIMQEGQVNLYTTPTIFGSFLRKASALTGIEEGKLREFVRFFPVTVGEAMNVNGGELRFDYTLHSIPTISIRADYLGKKIVYSSDTLDEPSIVRQLHDKGDMSAGRRDALLNFPWDADAIFHEAGVPPIHTPISFLTGLPQAVRERMYLVHVSPNDIPEGSGLRVAPSGLANTVELDVEPSYFDEAMEVLSVLLSIDMFKRLSLEKAREFMSIARKVQYRTGDYVFQEGEPSDSFYIIVSGKLDIMVAGRVLTSYSDGDYFGEKSLFLFGRRSATVVARTDAILLAIKNQQMRAFIRGTEIEPMLRSLALFQNQELREMLRMNPVLRRLTATQQTQMHKIVEMLGEPLPVGSLLIREEETTAYCYFIRSGSIDVIRKNLVRATLGRGELFGVAAALSTHARSYFTFVVNEPAELVRIRSTDLLEFVKINPGVYANLFFYDY